MLVTVVLLVVVRKLLNVTVVRVLLVRTVLVLTSVRVVLLTVMVVLLTLVRLVIRSSNRPERNLISQYAASRLLC